MTSRGEAQQGGDSSAGDTPTASPAGADRPGQTQPLSDAKQGVVVVVERDGLLLVIQRAAGILAGGSWCFVGGAIEPGEQQAEAAAREFTEEVGGAVRPVRKIWQYVRPDGKLLLHWWLAELTDDRLTANPLEVADFRWATTAEIAELPTMLESNQLFLADLASGAVSLDLQD